MLLRQTLNGRNSTRPLSELAGAELLKPNALDLLEAVTFAKLMQDATFSENLARRKTIKKAE